MKIPYIAGEWQMLFKPEKTGNYINDHTIFKAHDGNYHLFGITSFLGGAPNERYFAHGVTKDLSIPMIEQRKKLTEELLLGHRVLFAQRAIITICFTARHPRAFPCRLTFMNGAITL